MRSVARNLGRARTPVVLVCVASGCLAWVVRSADARQGNTQPASVQPSGAQAKAHEGLERVRTALGGVRALSYRAWTEVMAGDGVGVGTASISATRADAGGWKLAASGSTIRDPQATKERERDEQPFELAYDGVSARSLREKDKVVVERNVDDLEQLRQFFGTQGARHVVGWEVLEDPPLATVTSVDDEKGATIDGIACDVYLLHLEGGTDQARPKLRLYVSRQDHLPRRIERLTMDPSGKLLSGRALELRDLRTNDQAQTRAYTIDVPSGFRVRAGTGLGGGRRTTDRGEDEGRGRAGPGQSPGLTTDQGQDPMRGAKVSWESDDSLLSPGTQAPAFRLKDPQGKVWELKDLKGKVVVLDFWATWCGPCRTAMPALQRVHDKFKDKDVVVIGMNFNENGDPVKFKKDNGYTYTLLLDAESVGDDYKIRGIPAFYVIDAEGKVAWAGVGLRAPEGQRRATAQAMVEYLETTLSRLVEAELGKK